MLIGAHDVTCVGTVSFDRVALVDHAPSPDERVEATDLVSVVGGPAFVAAVTLGKLGVDVTFVGAVGEDEDADRIRHGMESQGVSPEYLITTGGQSSAGSVILVDREQGARSIAHRRGPTIDASSPQLHDACARSSWLHADHHGWSSVEALTKMAAPRQSPRLSLDGAYLSPDSVRLEDVFLYAPPETALHARYPGKDMRQALTSAHAEGVDVAVVTRGVRGSAAYSLTTGYIEVPGCPVDVLSTLGAGDVFHGALLAALVRDMPLVDSLRWANAAAALSCGTLDAQSGIPTVAELQAHLAACPATSTADTSVTRKA